MAWMVLVVSYALREVDDTPAATINTFSTLDPHHASACSPRLHKVLKYFALRSHCVLSTTVSHSHCGMVNAVATNLIIRITLSGLGAIFQ